jgi:hypothetical protein
LDGKPQGTCSRTAEQPCRPRSAGWRGWCSGPVEMFYRSAGCAARQGVQSVSRAHLVRAPPERRARFRAFGRTNRSFEPACEDSP